MTSSVKQSENSQIIHLLLVEDDEDDYVLVESYLEQAYDGNIAITWADTYEKAQQFIAQSSYDIYLIDYYLGQQNGLDLTKEITSNTFVVNAVILLTGLDDHKIDMEATKSGAMDYLVKQELSAALLERSIRYALSRKSIEEKLIAMAQHDPLTGLANRVKFNMALSDKIQYARREQAQFAVLLLDLDNFKEVNDTLGHSTGDVLLKVTARRLHQSLRDIDIIARLGGDEFVIIAEFNNIAEGSANIAERLIEELAEPLELDCHHVNTGVSIGIAIYPHDGISPEALLKSADLAMYKSKRGGRSTYRYYDPVFELELTQTKQLQTELQLAIDSNQFELHYQPIIDTESGRVVKAEALIRWQHPKKGLLPPAMFIPTAEKNSMIITIGEWVLQQACRDCKQWQTMAQLQDTGVTVNLSPLQFRDENLIPIVSKAIASIQLNHKHVTLEITETTLMEIGEDVIERLTMLDKLGVDIAIDDFGTGYSSLSYLKQFPVSTLKVDRSFISDIDDEDDDKIITKAIVNLGQSLNKKVIAEGIEKIGQLEIVNQLGCHYIQGYHFTKAMPFKEFTEWTQRFHSKRS